MHGTRIDLFAIATLHRMLQGFAMAYVFATSAQLAALNDAGVFFKAVMLGTAACGVAIGAAMDRRLVFAAGRRVASIFSLAILAAGLFLLRMETRPEIALGIALLIGLAAGTDWSSTSELARQSLSTRKRWRGMRWWTVAFVLGFAAAVPAFDQAVVVSVAACLTIGLIPLLSFAKSLPAIKAAVSVGSPSETPSPLPDAQAAPEKASTAFPGISGEADCDETECCGGSSRAFVPTSFWHGVTLSAVGFFVLFAMIGNAWGSAATQDSNASLIALAGGLAAGYWLITNAAPRAGYAVALLPFLVFSLVTTVAGIFVTPVGGWLPVACFLVALFAGGIVCGISALLGELFSDCPTDAQRTRLLVVSLFVTSMLVMVRGFLEFMSGSAAVAMTIDGAMLVTGILAIRAIPAPVVSSLGVEDRMDEDDEELNDVIASLNA